MKSCQLLPALAIAFFLTSNALAESVKSSPWLTDLAAAKQMARQSGKPILAVFR